MSEKVQTIEFVVSRMFFFLCRCVVYFNQSTSRILLSWMTKDRVKDPKHAKRTNEVCQILATFFV